MLPRLLPKRLPRLGRIDGGDAHLHLLVGTRWPAAGSEGVAVADGNDQAKQGSEGHRELGCVFAGTGASVSCKNGAIWLGALQQHAFVAINSIAVCCVMTMTQQGLVWGHAHAAALRSTWRATGLLCFKV